MQIVSIKKDVFKKLVKLSYVGLSDNPIYEEQQDFCEKRFFFQINPELSADQASLLKQDL